jgi:hypothetical protein
MPASSIIVNGRTTRRPNVYSQIDASSMQTNGPGVYSLVLIGDAIGGKPASAFESSELPFLTATTPDEVSAIFSGGDLRKAGLLAFAASNDPKVPNSPQRILFYKTNNSTQASLNLKGVSSAGLADVLSIESIDYSARSNQVSIAVEDGSSEGTLKLTVLDQVSTEVFDNIGADAALRLLVAADAPFSSLDLTSSETSLNGRSKLAFDLDDYAPNDVAYNARLATDLNITQAQVTDLSVDLFGLDGAGLPATERLTFPAGSTAALNPASVVQVTGLNILDEFRGSLELKNVGGDFIFNAQGTIENHLDAAAERLVFEDANAGTATIVGKLFNGDVHQEEVDLANQTDSLAAFIYIDSIIFSEAQAALVTVKGKTSQQAFTRINAGVISWGAGSSLGLLDLSSRPFAGGGLSLQLDNAAVTPGFVVVRGTDASGAVLAEKAAIAIGDVIINFAQNFKTITQAELGEFSDSDTPTTTNLTAASLSLEAFSLNYESRTLADLIVHLSAISGLTASAARDNSNLIDASVLDTGAVQVSSAAPAMLFAFNYDVEQALASSGLVSATSIKRVKPNKAAAKLLEGGSDFGFDASGNALTASTAADFLAAYSALEAVKNVIIVPLSYDESVHLALGTHCRHMEGVGRDERNGHVALPLSLDKAQIKARIRNLNNRNVSVVAQSIKAYNELGELNSLGSKMLAVVAGAMQAGSSIGMPLTSKIINIQDLSQSNDWAPSRSAEEMIELGLMFARFDQERGYVWERSITSSRENNAAFTELSTNESVNVSTKTARRAVENRIGDRLFAGLAGVIKGLIAAELQRQIESGIIKSFAAKSISVKDLGDGFDVSYEIAPLEPVNFIRITAHIKRSPVSA